jgi:hypothetical protein
MRSPFGSGGLEGETRTQRIGRRPVDLGVLLDIGITP